MTRHVVVGLLLAACATEEPQPTLGLDGPTEIVVREVGIVDGPAVVLSDGTEPDGILWSVSPDEVATVTDGVVHAVGPGEATVIGVWEGQEVRWTLLVDTALVLRFVDAPAGLGVGEEIQLEVVGSTGQKTVKPTVVEWTSSDEAILAVDDGRVTAYQPGLAYVTAASGSSRAQLQLNIK